MKKLAFLFTILLSLVFIVGCNSGNKTIRFNPEKTENSELAEGESKTTVTPIDEKEEGKTPSIEIKEKEITGTLAITKPEGSADITTGYFVITGTTPNNTAKVTVNDYQLKKYRSGQMRWSYIASTSADTLKEGKNDYTVKAFDKEGNEIGTASTSLNYTPVAKEVSELPGVGASAGMWAALMTLMTLSGLFYIKNKATV